VIFRDLLSALPPGRLLDLATGHGGFALIGQELGWEVTAVDARTERMPMTPGIEWIQADVRQFPTDGYDVITILGLLYHLELEAQADLLRRCSSTLTVIDTHVSMRPTTLMEGYLGHFFEETLSAHTASWGNPLSFWLTEKSLYRLLLRSGYASVFKVLPPPVTADRTFHVVAPESHPNLAELKRRFRSSNGNYRIEPRLENVMVGSVDDHMYQVVSEMATLREERDTARDALARLDDHMYQVVYEMATLRQERDSARDALARLRNRRSVRLALQGASLVKPLYRQNREPPGD